MRPNVKPIETLQKTLLHKSSTTLRLIPSFPKPCKIALSQSNIGFLQDFDELRVSKPRLEDVARDVDVTLL